MAGEALLGDQHAGATHLAVVEVEAAADHGRERLGELALAETQELRPRLADRLAEDLEQALLLRFEVVVERGRPEPDGLRHFRPLGVFVALLAEVLGRDRDDLRPFAARRSLRLHPRPVAPARHLPASSISACHRRPPAGRAQPYTGMCRVSVA